MRPWSLQGLPLPWSCPPWLSVVEVWCRAACCLLGGPDPDDLLYSGKLAAEVSKAGGFGFVGTAFETPAELRDQLNIARSILNTSDDATLAVGVGFIGWILDENEAAAKELISVAFEYRVKAIWLSHGDNLGKWVEYYRSLIQQTGHHPLLFVQIFFPDGAKVAVNEWKADAIVAQGVEAGGHGAAHGLPLLTLLPLVLSALRPDAPPVIAAGGVATGSQVAALIILGAAGVALGTRFLLSPESLYTDKERQAIIDAESPDTVRTLAFDEARGYHNWPKYINGRAIRNKTYDDFDSEKGVDIAIIRQKYAEASAVNDTDRVVVWSGAGISAMNKVLPAKDIVKELHDDCVATLGHSGAILKELTLTGYGAAVRGMEASKSTKSYVHHVIELPSILSGVQPTKISCLLNPSMVPLLPSPTVALTDLDPPYEVLSTPHKGFGMFAKRPIPKGSLILIEHPACIIPGFASDDLTTEDYEKVGRSIPPEVYAEVEKMANCRTKEECPTTIEGVARTNALTLGLEFPPGFDKVDPRPVARHYGGLFLKIGRCNHSCGPNAAWKWDFPSLSSTLFALRDIRAGDEICHTYVNPLQSREERWKKLKPDYRFECDCPWCTLPTPEAQAESDRNREYVGMYLQTRPTYSKWSVDPCLPDTFVIDSHLAVSQIIKKEGLDRLIPLFMEEIVRCSLSSGMSMSSGGGRARQSSYVGSETRSWHKNWRRYWRTQRRTVRLGEEEST
ncbi:hypothetical protein NMY22_g18559 [Coprinellus aureogranulatus]|nr:hypothetical protein NMY22_g18559 [Coprinellus aureogranulatus]